LVTESMVGSSMQVQNKIRFLLVAGRTQKKYESTQKVAFGCFKQLLL